MIPQNILDFLDSQNLAFVATVSPDGRPNISPKGTVIPWNSETLAFADIRSPDTVRNIRSNPAVEINIVDPLLRKGFLFQGTAEILGCDSLLYQEILDHYHNICGVKSIINSIVLVRVTSVSPVVSPLYDDHKFLAKS